jgi:hypothetical protein
MSIKLRVLLLQFVVFLTVISPVFSFDDMGLLEDYSSPSTPTKTPPKAQSIVPRTDGSPQDTRAFEFLFKGQEDPAAVRVTTRPPLRQYTFTEKMKSLFLGEEPDYSTLSGTMTSHGVITNGHGFVEEVPCFTNWLRKICNSKNRLYRTLEPAIIEQGLTIEHFSSNDQTPYFDENFLPNVPTSTHAIYDSKDVKSVFLMEDYLVSSGQRTNGWIYGSLNSKHDVALIELEENRYPEKICQIAESLPSSDLHKVAIYQYPFGHPLQKKSVEFADFSKKTHQAVTFGGSSGSALRDFDSGFIIGVHKAGTDFHNLFIPLSLPMLTRLNIKIYSTNHDSNKKY